jgi:hypothetical protein
MALRHAHRLGLDAEAYGAAQAAALGKGFVGHLWCSIRTDLFASIEEGPSCFNTPRNQLTALACATGAAAAMARFLFLYHDRPHLRGHFVAQAEKPWAIPA